MTCNNCGSDNSNNEIICEDCGESIITKIDIPEEEVSLKIEKKSIFQKIKKSFMFILIGSLIIIFTIVTLNFPENNSSKNGSIQLESNITYKELLEKSEENKNKLISFSGVVVGMFQTEEHTLIKVSFDGKVNDVVLAAIPTSDLIKELKRGDNIGIFGLSAGLYEYKGTDDTNLKIPLISVNTIETE